MHRILGQAKALRCPIPVNQEQCHVLSSLAKDGGQYYLSSALERVRGGVECGMTLKLSKSLFCIHWARGSIREFG